MRPTESWRGDELARAPGAEQVEREIDLRLGADERFELVLFRGYVRTHDAGQTALVRDGQGCVAEVFRARDELLELAGAAEEGDVGDAAQLCVGGNVH